MNLSVLEKLCNLSGVSGNETNVSNYIYDLINEYSDKAYKDPLGNLYLYKQSKTKTEKTVMLCAHMDEVGLIVSSVTDDGFLKFRTVGGIEAGVLIGKKVRIGEKKVLGVIGVKAIHLIPKDKRDDKIEISDMYIDIGATSRDEALKYASPGDFVCFITKFEEMGDLIKAKALDDRVGCFILTELIKNDYDLNIWFCFNVQEELGLRGASVSSKTVKADTCLVIEGTTCLDFPNTPPNKVCTRVGDGVVITIADKSTFPDAELREKLVAVSPKSQFKSMCSGGNDAGAIHLNNIKTESLSIPARYIHSPVSVVSTSDIKHCIETIHEFLKGEAINDWYA